MADDWNNPPQRMEAHPCWRERLGGPSHRSGGFGGTCERCGTPIEGPNNEPIAGLRWEPVIVPKPFCPGSLERAIYDALLASGAPIHNGWKEALAEQISAAIRPDDPMPPDREVIDHMAGQEVEDA